MKIVRERRKHSHRHGEAAILFDAGGYTFAIAATDVDEIRDVHMLVPVSHMTERSSVAKIKYTLERNSRIYYVVDSCTHFRLAPSNPTRLLILRTQPVAVLVDSIDRMTQIDRLLALPHAFQADERRWYRGLALLEGKVVPVVNAAAFLTAADQVIANSVIQRKAAEATA